MRSAVAVVTGKVAVITNNVFMLGKKSALHNGNESIAVAGRSFAGSCRHLCCQSSFPLDLIFSGYKLTVCIYCRN